MPNRASESEKSPAPVRKTETAQDVYRRLWPYLRPHWRTIAFGALCLLVSIPATAFHPIVWAHVVDDVIGKHRVGLLVPWLVAMFVVQAFGTAVEALRDNLLQKVGQRVVYDLRNDVYDKLQRQSLSYLHERPLGDLLSRAMSDIDVIQEAAVQGTDSVVASFLGFIYVAAILIAFNARLGLVTLLPILFVFVLTRRFNLRVKQLYREVRDRLGAVNARLQENLAGMTLIKAFAKERNEAARFRTVGDLWLRANFRAINARTTFFPAVRLIGFVSNMISLGYGAWLVLHGQFTVGGLIAYRGYWWPLFQPVNSLATVNELLQRARAAGSRVFEILDSPETIADAPDAKPLVLTDGRVEFRRVTFSYAGTNEAAQSKTENRKSKIVLRDVSFTVSPGEMVALVGPSGAGKTTTLNLIPRFYEPQAGEVRIDGQDVRAVTQESLRRRFAVVQQETFLFGGTVLENIRYGNPEATMEEVEAAVRAANAADFIAELPRGYETEIGERGVKLSGGQRQRLSIARAFLANPAILILDEPTSSVEPESEAIITQALERLMRGRTTFVTSHRFSLVRGADRILVFDEGRLVEQGCHAELVELGSLYAAMYAQQMGERIADCGLRISAAGRGAASWDT